MIPIVREFFRGLRERDELDVIIPELLTAMGFEVISRPMVGTRQYGADVAAIGTDTDGRRKLFLFSIKRGDLNRQEWNGVSDQALRPSLDEIRDVYLSGVAPEHRGLPVVVCITIGGVVLENVLPMVNGYMRDQSKDGIEFRLWTGDTLTGKIVDGALREEVFPPDLRAMLRRAAALVEEPEAALAQFRGLIAKVVADTSQDELSRVRILYLALWILTVWGREAGNLEAPYQASEWVTLHAWELLWRQIESGEGRQAAGYAFNEVVELHLRIWNELYRDKILPHAASLHALSHAVHSREPVDVNMALFKTAGRVAMGGLWRAWLDGDPNTAPGTIESPQDVLLSIVRPLSRMARANGALYTPVSDDQGIDLTLALTLLCMVPETRQVAAEWVSQAARASIISYKRHRAYPIIATDYPTLIRHPASEDDEYRREMTSGSILYPMLAAFAWGLGDGKLVAEIDAFKQVELGHCNFQTWVPNAGTEARLWRGDRPTGSSLGSLAIGGDGSELIGALRREVEQNQAYAALSAIRLDHWPILLLACRCYRLPPPPQIWLPLLEEIAATHAGSSAGADEKEVVVEEERERHAG